MSTMPTAKLSQRFKELVNEAAVIDAAETWEDSEYSGRYQVIDNNRLIGWRVKVKNLLVSACGKESEHYRDFVSVEENRAYRNAVTELQQLDAVLKAARGDYDNGYLDTVRTLVQAEVFSDELDQARALPHSSYSTPAAVVAGVVLETKMREMCLSRGLDTGELDKMNADLSTAGVYSLVIQKRITALADVRNNAAHGHPDKFTYEDVSDMIAYIERFLTDYI